MGSAPRPFDAPLPRFQFRQRSVLARVQEVAGDISKSCGDAAGTPSAEISNPDLALRQARDSLQQQPGGCSSLFHPGTLPPASQSALRTPLRLPPCPSRERSSTPAPPVAVPAPGAAAADAVATLRTYGAAPTSSPQAQSSRFLTFQQGNARIARLTPPRRTAHTGPQRHSDQRLKEANGYPACHGVNLGLYLPNRLREISGKEGRIR